MMKRTILMMLVSVAAVVGIAAVAAPSADALGSCRVVAGKIVCGSGGIPIPTITPKAS